MPDNSLLLQSPTAAFLYEQYAKDAPIYDYHCHLSAREIYEDKVFEDISDMWLKHDHYKWRAMRFAGVNERLVTGSASAVDKFRAFARTSARLVGSPLYHWVHLELKTYFGITETLDETNADQVYAHCNALIREKQMRPSSLIRQSNVRLIGTTDDPVDTLEWHARIADQKNPDLLVLPTFRPDRALQIHLDTYQEYLQQLAASAGQASIPDYDALLAALRQRIDYFNAAGCLLSDHSLETLDCPPVTHDEAAAVFARRLSGEKLTAAEIAAFRTFTLLELAAAYEEKEWVMQLHIGALRNNNPAMFAQLGPDSGYDIMNDFAIAAPLASLLSRMQAGNHLPATILYSLNSKDNLVLSTLPHCFADGKLPGKVQFGSAWWFNDTLDGMYEHFKAIAAQSMLTWFVGMLTDSRSFLSYTRHDYFRRILCKFVGEKVDNGEFAAKPHILKEIIEGVCYKNIVRYLGLDT